MGRIVITLDNLCFVRTLKSMVQLGSMEAAFEWLHLIVELAAGSQKCESIIEVKELKNSSIQDNYVILRGLLRTLQSIYQYSVTAH